MPVDLGSEQIRDLQLDGEAESPMLPEAWALQLKKKNFFFYCNKNTARNLSSDQIFKCSVQY